MPVKALCHISSMMWWKRRKELQELCLYACMPSVVKVVVGMEFCQLLQDPVIVNGAGRDAFVARLVEQRGGKERPKKKKNLPEV